MTGPGQHVHIENRRDGGVFYWLGKLYLFAALVLAVIPLIAGMCVYAEFAPNVRVRDFSNYVKEVPTTTRMYAADGSKLGEFAVEWRDPAAYEEIPSGLIDAVLAAEDHRFFEHRGVDIWGTLRAVKANLMASHFAQGGSTITMQVEKQLKAREQAAKDDELIRKTPKKTIGRKIEEAISARRMEQRYSKKAILAVYLNEIYLGSGAYGVRAAGRRYFNKELSELDLGEMAMLAGLARGPSRYSPIARPEAALKRRNEVLARMARYGYIDDAGRQKWQAAPLETNPSGTVFPSQSPWFAEHVRRHVIEKYGKRALMTSGLRIETTVQPSVDIPAYENVDHGARRQDKRQGWRGPEAHLEGGGLQTFLKRSAARYSDAPLERGRRYLALVTEVENKSAVVRVGTRDYSLALADMRWAHEWKTNGVNDRKISRVNRALTVGDIVWVSRKTFGRGQFREWRLDGHNPRWQPPQSPSEHDATNIAAVTLEQAPHPQSALLTADHRNGYVVAMVGGTDFYRSQFNRAVQACRQPGSTYKPIYYSLALNEGYGYDTLLNDRLTVEVDPDGTEWTPENLGGVVSDTVTLEYALVFSKNIPSVAIFKKLGGDNVLKWARRLGFTTKIIPDRALSLGASCTKLDELSRAFMVFANNGIKRDFVYVRRIVDRHGKVLEDNTSADDPALSPRDRFDRVFAIAGRPQEQLIPARTGYLTSKLLRQAMDHGFAGIVRKTGIRAAGKTGTSSATMDTSFVGYTSKWLTTVWLGDEKRQRPLGLEDAAYMTVVPLWARYMYEVGRDHPNEVIPWQVPPGVKPSDRGDRRGNTGARMRLVYRSGKTNNGEQ